MKWGTGGADGSILSSPDILQSVIKSTSSWPDWSTYGAGNKAAFSAMFMQMGATTDTQRANINDAWTFESFPGWPAIQKQHFYTKVYTLGSEVMFVQK